MGHSPQSCKELDTTEVTQHAGRLCQPTWRRPPCPIQQGWEQDLSIFNLIHEDSTKVLFLFATHSSMNTDVEGRDVLDFNLTSIHLCLGSILKCACLKIILMLVQLKIYATAQHKSFCLEFVLLPAPDTNLVKKSKNPVKFKSTACWRRQTIKK